MKKVIYIGRLQNVPNNWDGQIIGFRAKDPHTKTPIFYVQNLEIQGAHEISFDANGILTLKLQLGEGEIIAVGNAEGAVGKTVLQPV